MKEAERGGWGAGVIIGKENEGRRLLFEPTQAGGKLRWGPPGTRESVPCETQASRWTIFVLREK